MFQGKSRNWVISQKAKLEIQRTMTIQQLVPISWKEAFSWGGEAFLTIDEFIELGPEQGKFVRQLQKERGKRKRTELYLELIEIRNYWEKEWLNVLEGEGHATPLTPAVETKFIV